MPHCSCALTNINPLVSYQKSKDVLGEENFDESAASRLKRLPVLGNERHTDLSLVFRLISVCELGPWKGSEEI